MTAPWTVLIPVKRPALAKSRLAVAPTTRAALARAFALDTIDAALQCAQVQSVRVITADDEVTARASELGATVVVDSTEGDLNQCLRDAAAPLPPSPLVALVSDLPALRPHELGSALIFADHLLRVASRHSAGFLPDCTGNGTTLLAASANSGFDPRFGMLSAAAHRASGARPLRTGGVDTVRRDVDTLRDLRAALLLGVGPHTARVCRAAEGWQLLETAHST
ncbi:MAG: 2-phospho-L-lactate guanylyltransferase [Comamonadaceae bacterium]|nr:MAG: 2-phospho-L-lactate guanylyltransferase [Comamonadaceae bacterium]